MRFSPTERIGVSTIENLTLREFGWIFREQPVVDMGIDAHLEFVDENGQPSGKLLALQIKTGPSHLTPTNGGYNYYGSTTHLEYWTGHSLPVLLVCHLPATNTTLWQIITMQNITLTKNNWKIFIPISNTFDKGCKRQIESFFEGTPSQQKFRSLTLDLPLIRHVAAGQKVTVELQRWYNKSLGRSPVQIFVFDNDGEEHSHSEWDVIHLCRDIKTLALLLFPWANVVIDQDFYELNMEFEEDDRERLMRATDIDNGFEPYTPSPTDIYPYADHAGELESYRLQLVLNDLGRSFLTLSSYLEAD